MTPKGKPSAVAADAEAAGSQKPSRAASSGGVPVSASSCLPCCEVGSWGGCGGGGGCACPSTVTPTPKLTLVGAPSPVSETCSPEVLVPLAGADTDVETPVETVGRSPPVPFKSGLGSPLSPDVVL